MKTVIPSRWSIGAATAIVTLAAATGALGQAQQFIPGTDCSKVPANQQIDCQAQQQNSTMTPGPDTPLPAGNGSGTNQNGTLGTNGSSGLGAGGANPPGQSGN